MAKRYKLPLVLICLVLSQVSFGQKREVQNAYMALDQKDLPSALTSINNATNDDVTKTMAKTWLYRGKIMDAIYNSPTDKSLVVDPLYDEMVSYIKAYHLDEKKEYKDDIFMALYNVFTIYYNDAAQSLRDTKYGAAYKGFGRALEVMKVLRDDNPKAFKVSPDTVNFYKGFTAYKVEKYPAAKSAFSYLIDSTNYRTPDLYTFQSNTLLALSDTAGALTVLEKGKAQFPNDLSIMLTKINIYLFTNHNKEAIGELKDAISKLPNAKLPDADFKTRSSDLYNALGDAYDRTNDTTSANAAYRKSIDYEPGNFKPYFSLGAAYYNEAVDINKTMNKLGTSDAEMKKYNDMKVDRDKYFTLAIPYLEKAHSINNKDMDTLKALKEIYIRTNQNDKADAIKKEIDALGGK